MNKFLRKGLLLICFFVFVYSAFQLTTILFEYKDVENETENLITDYIDEGESDSNQDNLSDDETQIVDPLSRVVKFDDLLELNKDVVGWLYIPDTTIDEPLLKGENNDSYLRKDIYKKKLTAGQIFVDETNDGNLSDSNTIIYGHNMKNGTRFHNLRYYVKKDYYESHPYVYIYLPDGSVNVYEVYAASIISAYSDLYSADISYSRYIKNVQKDAKQTTEVSKEEAPLIMLSTCYSSHSDDRYVVFARLKENVKIINE